MCAAACGRYVKARFLEAIDETMTKKKPSLRVVSLIASSTEILNALGAGKLQVGRSHECDYPPSVLDLPAITRPKSEKCICGCMAAEGPGIPQA